MGVYSAPPPCGVGGGGGGGAGSMHIYGPCMFHT